MSYGTVQAEKMTTESGYSLGAGNASSFKNRIINGRMTIDQRNNGASITVNSNVNYPVDRFSPQFNTTTGTAQRSTVAPAGFTNSMLITNGSGVAPSAGQYNGFRQEIEGFNTADLGLGTANAQTFTLSFWVRSSITGTYAGRLANAGDTRTYVFTYGISSANTWEYKTITVAGDTTGTWLTDNGRGIQIIWDLGSGSNFNGTAGVWGTSNVTRTSGSVNWIATTGATFYITGVQLEVGTVATSFDFRSIGTELALCQRYYQRIDSAGNLNFPLVQMWWSGTSVGLANPTFSPTMRAAPAFSWSNVSAWSASGSSITVNSISLTSATTSSGRLDVATATSPYTAGQTSFLHSNAESGLGVLQFSAEL